MHCDNRNHPTFVRTFLAQMKRESGPAVQPIEYTVRRSRRRRRTMEITVDARGAVRVAAPNHASSTDIGAFVQARASWIEKQRKARRVRPAMPRRLVTGESLSFLGREYTLLTHEGTNRHSSVRLEGRALAVSLAQTHDTSQPSAALVSALEAWYRLEAERIIASRMLHYQQRIGVQPKAFRMSNAKARWGSCASGGTVRISWRLIMAPLPLIDYVVVHELCHLRHPNHGSRFWRLVETVLPDYKLRRVHLRREGARYAI